MVIYVIRFRIVESRSNETRNKSRWMVFYFSQVKEGNVVLSERGNCLLEFSMVSCQMTVFACWRRICYFKHSCCY